MLFPPEIIDSSVEMLFVKRTVRSRIIYITVLLSVVATVAALPFIHVQVSTQARGIIRTANENNPLQSAVYGEVTEIRIKENGEVRRGDTLVILNSGNIRVQTDRLAEKIREYSAFVSDISSLLAENYTALQTPKYLNENNLYHTSVNEYQIKTDYLKNELSIAENLYRKEITSQSEYLQCKNSYETAVLQRDNQREQFRNRWQSWKTKNLTLRNTASCILFSAALYSNYASDVLILGDGRAKDYFTLVTVNRKTA
ncbi:MAG: biotin/lipoyl-binding protein [Prevotellaceae bacterium]|jgi:HlyD family secretion protein|nr:biotin/lipoyl-binding protein [Prevotellaceae bacterium]